MALEKGILPRFHNTYFSAELLIFISSNPSEMPFLTQAETGIIKREPCGREYSYYNY